MMISGLGLGHKKDGLRVHARVISFTDAHDVSGREFREQSRVLLDLRIGLPVAYP